MTEDDDSVDMTTRLCLGAVWAIVCFAAGLVCEAGVGESALHGLVPGFVLGALIGPHLLDALFQWGFWW